MKHLRLSCRRGRRRPGADGSRHVHSIALRTCIRSTWPTSPAFAGEAMTRSGHPAAGRDAPPTVTSTIWCRRSTSPRSRESRPTCTWPGGSRACSSASARRRRDRADGCLGRRDRRRARSPARRRGAAASRRSAPTTLVRLRGTRAGSLARHAGRADRARRGGRATEGVADDDGRGRPSPTCSKGSSTPRRTSPARRHTSRTAGCRTAAPASSRRARARPTTSEASTRPTRPGCC